MSRRREKSTEGIRTPPDAARLRAQESTLKLPDDWNEAISTVDRCAKHARIDYAVVGSLGVALSLGLPWEPLKSSTGDQLIRPRDLDVFLIGTPAARRKFREALRSARARSGPIIDLVSWYHDFTEFGPAEAALRFRAVRVPIDAALFRTIRIRCAGVSIPVLHPRVQMHLIEMLPTKTAKAVETARSLASALSGDFVRFPEVSEADCQPFRAFKEERARRYPLRERVIAFRQTLWGWEETGRWKPLVATKVRLREHHPGLAERLRRLFG
jgi:hypothetical protein